MELVVVAFLVTCSDDYLHCQTLDTDRFAWRDPQRCNSEITRLISDYRRDGYGHVMGKCRIVIPDEKYKTRPIG